MLVVSCNLLRGDSVLTEFKTKQGSWQSPIDYRVDDEESQKCGAADLKVLPEFR
jgi:hypothetical protein